MDFKLTNGNRKVPILIPGTAHVTELQPVTLPPIKQIHSVLEDVLENPIGSKPIADFLYLKQPKSIAIAIPDSSCPIPVKDILSDLLVCIFNTLPSLDPSCVKIIVGSGLQQRPDTAFHHRILISAIALGCEVLFHNSKTSKMVDFGTTKLGTPVRVNTSFAEAELKICIGQIEPHQIIGFSGATEEVTIGCAAPESIEHFLSLMHDDRASVGRLDGNPARKNLNEASRMIGLGFAINVVLNKDRKVVRVLAGNPEETLRQGAEICADLYGVEIEHKFDIVVASCGTPSKNTKNYQLEKQFNLIAHVIQQGGKVILLTASPQGLGDDIYFDYVCQNVDPDNTQEEIKRFELQMDPSNAYLFGKTSVNYDLAIQSDLNPNILRRCHLRAADTSKIIKEWVDNFETQPKLAIIADTNIYIKERLTQIT